MRLISYFSVACLLAILLLTNPLDARVGESRSDIESRLTAAGGIQYRDRAIVSNRSRGMPYTRYMQYLDTMGTFEIYYKTFDGTRAKPSEIEVKNRNPGWELHVFYANDRSVMEIYSSTEEITEYELNQLLAFNSGGAYWEKASKEAIQEAAENTEDPRPSAFGYNFERSDKRLRASTGNKSTLLIMSADFDIKLAQVEESDLQQSAPVSTRGF